MSPPPPVAVTLPNITSTPAPSWMMKLSAVPLASALESVRGVLSNVRTAPDRLNDGSVSAIVANTVCAFPYETIRNACVGVDVVKNRLRKSAARRGCMCDGHVNPLLELLNRRLQFTHLA